jgi:hypothetical protein
MLWQPYVTIAMPSGKSMSWPGLVHRVTREGGDLVAVCGERWSARSDGGLDQDEAAYFGGEWCPGCNVAGGEETKRPDGQEAGCERGGGGRGAAKGGRRRPPDEPG